MQAKNFSLPDQDNITRSLSEYRNKWVVLYFYPKDDTPGCTKEACNFRDSYHEFEKRNIIILGVSKDSVASHKKFAEKYHLTFPLLSDSTGEIIKSYDAWGEKKFMGKSFVSIFRKTYLIDPNGDIKKVYEKVNPLKHASEVLQDISENIVE